MMPSGGGVIGGGSYVGTSSFGEAGTTRGPFSPGRSIIATPRFTELNKRQSYYDCTQHDTKTVDFDGRVIPKGAAAMSTQPLISSEKVPFFVPLRSRRPSSPYRLARVIVGAFTNMVFGEQRFPAIKVEGDAARQDFALTTAKLGGLSTKMIRMRNLGGATGSSALSWALVNGRPRFEVHNAKNIFVHSWLDREALIPEAATECYLYEEDRWNDIKRAWERTWFWYRRDWTPEADIVYQPALYDPKRDPFWVVDDLRTVQHGDGETHFHWCQNLPTEEIDGLPDYDGLYETFDVIDVLYSVISRGAVLNLDPTLVLQIDPDIAARSGVKKGSDNALTVGTDGDAKYLELAGTSIDVGIRLFESKRRSALEVAQCIVPDPADIAANGVSSVTIKTLFGQMIGKCDILREQYGSVMTRVLDQIVRVAANKVGSTTMVANPDTGAEEEVEAVLDYPPRVETTAVLDDDGNQTGEDDVKLIPREPGDAGECDLRWPPYFSSTVDDISKAATALQAATVGKPFLTQQTATEYLSGMMNQEPDAEWRRLQATIADEQAQTQSMFDDAQSGASGAVSHTQELPSGAQVTRTSTGPQQTASADKTAAKGVSLAPTDLAAIMTVDEARASANLPPLGGPDGSLTLAEFKAKHASAIATAANADLGKVGTPPPATPPKPPPGANPFGGPPKAPGQPGGAPPDPDAEDASQTPPKGAGGGFPPKG